MTRQLAVRHGKPCLAVDLDDALPAADVQGWLRTHRVEVLNVAGPRESHCPGIGRQAREYLVGLFKAW